MLMREVLPDGRVILQLVDAAGLAILTLKLHQPGAERLLHGHLFEWLDDRDEMLARRETHARLQRAAGDDVQVIPLIPR
jgi:hypothetical protein